MAGFNSKIRLEIISSLNAAGIKATADQLDKLEAKVKETENASGGFGDVLTKKFSPMTAITAAMTGNFRSLAEQATLAISAVKGVSISVGTMTGIIGGVSLAVVAVKKLIELFHEEKSAIDLASEAAERNAKAIVDSRAKVNSAMNAAMGKVDEVAKRRNAELESIEKEVAAEKRLQMETARRNGDLATAAKLEREIAIDVKNAAVAKKQAEIQTIRDKIAAADKVSMGGEGFDAKKNERQRRILNGRITRLQKELAKAERGVDVSNGRGISTTVRSEGRIADLKRELDMTVKAKEEFNKKTAKQADGNKAIAKLKDELTNAERDLSAFRKIEIAAEIKAVDDAVKKLAEEELKAEEERHRQKMANLQAEANAARSALNSAQSRFNAEFNLYKSGNAAAQIEAEKADEEARKRLNKEAAKYGGKWRINELSALYAEGDEGKIRDTLTEWRKRKSFTPEVEAMVRAAAAKDNAKTAEQSLAAIEKNTEDLAAKLDELLTMKGE